MSRSASWLRPRATFELAVRLLAAVESALGSLAAGVFWDPADARRAVAAAREALDDEAFCRSWDAGAGMTIAEAADEARRELDIPRGRGVAEAKCAAQKTQLLAEN